MKVNQLLISLLILLIFLSCNNNSNPKPTDIELWKLGWRMIENSWENNNEIADSQFDSLLNAKINIDIKFLLIGLEVKNKLGKEKAIDEILNKQNQDVLREICLKQFLQMREICKEFSRENIENEELQMELIKMYVDDQAVRGNIMEDKILKYNLDSLQITQDDGVTVDERNRNRLKEIFEEYGFPNKKTVGKDAMYGIFLMIQHSDGDKKWQKSQLKNIEIAVKNGDMDGQSYAYLYDRIKINNDEKQLYGTQFSKVDPVNKTVELFETEDIVNLDVRRMKIGMMPIKMFKKIMLKNI